MGERRCWVDTLHAAESLSTTAATAGRRRGMLLAAEGHTHVWEGRSDVARAGALLLVCTTEGN
jgi:hypothetical protein